MDTIKIANCYNPIASKFFWYAVTNFHLNTIKFYNNSMLNIKRKKKRRLVIMVSGRGKNMESIIKSCQKKNWPINIVGVISDNNWCNWSGKLFKIKNWVVDRKKFDNNRDLIKAYPHLPN